MAETVPHTSGSSNLAQRLFVAAVGDNPEYLARVLRAVDQMENGFGLGEQTMPQTSETPSAQPEAPMAQGEKQLAEPLAQDVEADASISDGADDRPDFLRPEEDIPAEPPQASGAPTSESSWQSAEQVQTEKPSEMSDEPAEFREEFLRDYERLVGQEPSTPAPNPGPTSYAHCRRPPYPPKAKDGQDGGADTAASPRKPGSRRLWPVILGVAGTVVGLVAIGSTAFLRSAETSDEPLSLQDKLAAVDKRIAAEGLVSEDGDPVATITAKLNGELAFQYNCQPDACTTAGAKSSIGVITADAKGKKLTWSEDAATDDTALPIIMVPKAGVADILSTEVIADGAPKFTIDLGAVGIAADFAIDKVDRTTVTRLSAAPLKTDNPALVAGEADKVNKIATNPTILGQVLHVKANTALTDLVATNKCNKDATSLITAAGQKHLSDALIAKAAELGLTVTAEQIVFAGTTDSWASSLVANTVDRTSSKEVVESALVVIAPQESGPLAALPPITTAGCAITPISK